eukprot:6104661-Amphidinium_carterae.2
MQLIWLQLDPIPPACEPPPSPYQGAQPLDPSTLQALATGQTDGWTKLQMAAQSVFIQPPVLACGGSGASACPDFPGRAADAVLL